MRSAWAAAALVSGLVACGFYDAVPSPSSPFGPDIGMPDAGLPNLPDGSYALPDGGFQLPDGGFQLPDGGFQLPDGGFNLPDGGWALPDGGFQLPDGGSSGCPGSACPPETLATGEQGTLPLALDAWHVYWPDQGLGALRRVPVSGTSTETLPPRGVLGEVLQVDTEAAYFIAATDGAYSLMKLPHGAAQATWLAGWSGGTVPREGLAQSATSLYAAVGGTLVEVSKQGGPMTTRVGANVQWLAGHADGVFFLDVAAGRLMSLGRSGSPNGVATLPADQRVTALHAGSAGLTVALQPATSSFWDCPGGSLLRPSGNGVGLTALTDTPGCVVALTADAVHLYWTAYVPGRGSFLLRAPLGGGQVGLVSVLGSIGFGIAVDDRHVYWSEQEAGSIRRVPKPPPGTNLDPLPN